MILNQLKQSPFFQTFKKALEESSSLLLESLWDTPKASLIHLLLEFRGKNLLVITGGEREDHLIQDLKLLSPFSPYLFPAWDTLPGEEMSPNLDLVGKRFEVLHQLLTQKGPHLILTPLQGALQMIPSPSLLQKHLSIWKKGSHLSFDTLPTTLSHLGYERKSVAVEKGECAVRGGIIDLFPISAALPYRVEFFGDEVEEIRTYDPMSQKSIEKVESFLLSPASEKLLLEQGTSYLLDLIGKESIVCFDDLLAIEDRLVKLKDHPAFSRSSFLPFPTFLEKTEAMQKLFFSNTALESLSSEIKQEGEELSFEIINQKVKTPGWRTKAAAP
ncbi:MAG: transcription-repair coupling factor, partial [Simkania negevensis]|nr:transcription-repair coupling factor [Simkania negevensis]